MILNVLNNVLSILFGFGSTIYYFYGHQTWTAQNILKGIGAGLLFYVLSWIAIFILIWLVVLGIALTINTKKEYTSVSKVYYNLLNFWYSYICAMFRLKINCSGLEKVPQGKRFLIVCNHRSKLDNMVQSALLKKNEIAYISKIENFHIPVARRYMKRALYLGINRGHMKSALQTVFKAIDYINNDITSIGVFPEGSRTKDGKLQAFKPGCLKIAEKSGCPIVVCTIDGTEKVHKNFPWKKTVVNFDVIEVYSEEKVKASSTVDLADEISKQMLEKLGK